MSAVLDLFKNWIKGREDFTLEELLEIYISSFLLTDDAIRELRDYVARQTPKNGKDRSDLLKRIKELRMINERLQKDLAASKKEIENLMKKPIINEDLLIGRTPYPKWWKDLRAAAISLSTTGSQIVITPRADFFLYVATIVFTVNAETIITLGFGTFGSTGPLSFGGTGQPMGIVIAMGESPVPCGVGGFSITSTGEDVAVGGFVSYYLEHAREERLLKQ